MTRLLVSQKERKTNFLDEHKANVVFGVLYLWQKYFLFLFPDLFVFGFLHGLNMTNFKKKKCLFENTLPG